MATQIIERKSMLCPACEQVHEIDLLVRPVLVRFHGKTVTYDEKSYFCPVDNCHFYDGEMLDENLVKIRELLKK